MPELNNTILKNSANLKGYWRLESNGNDSGPNGYNLTGTSPTYTTALFGNGGDFESSSSQYLSASAANCRIAGSQSFSAWVKVESLPVATQSRIIGVSDSTPTNYVALTLMDTGKYAFQVSGLTATQILSDVDAVIGTWTHVVGVYNSSTSKLFVYVNALAKELAVTGSHTAGSGNLAIGRLGDYTSASTYFDGFIDDVAVFDIALSADQVKELYEGRYIGELPKDTGCQGLWHFNGNITDFSSNNYHLTNTGTTDVAGKLGNARDFNGSSQYLTVAAANCNIATSQTWHSIIKADSLGDRCLHYIRNSAGGSSRGVTIVSGTNKLRADFDGLTGGSVSQSGTISTGVWYDVFAIYDSSASKVKIWVNGLKTEGSCSGTPATITGNVVIGRGGDRNEYYFDGIIDEVGMYNRAWSDKEVLSYYANARGKY